jgi:hypothetical protein
LSLEFTQNKPHLTVFFLFIEVNNFILSSIIDVKEYFTTTGVLDVAMVAVVCSCANAGIAWEARASAPMPASGWQASAPPPPEQFIF